MDRQQIGLLLSLNQLDIELKTATFDDRLILQKSVCILQHAGIDLGYHFNWYLRGPYCPSLTNDVFEITPNLVDHQNQLGSWTLDEKSISRIGEIAPLFSQPEPEAKAEFLEVCASILFVLKANKGKIAGAEQLNELLTSKGKDFSVEQVDDALNQLRKKGLVD